MSTTRRPVHPDAHVAAQVEGIIAGTQPVESACLRAVEIAAERCDVAATELAVRHEALAEAADHVGTLAQLDINEVYRDKGAEAALATLRGRAQAAHRAHPQMNGAWMGDEWHLGLMRRDFTTKGGLRFCDGDVVMYREGRDESGLHFTAYSTRGGINVALTMSATPQRIEGGC